MSLFNHTPEPVSEEPEKQISMEQLVCDVADELRKQRLLAKTKKRYEKKQARIQQSIRQNVVCYSFVLPEGVEYMAVNTEITLPVSPCKGEVVFFVCRKDIKPSAADIAQIWKSPANLHEGHPGLSTSHALTMSSDDILFVVCSRKPQRIGHSCI